MTGTRGDRPATGRTGLISSSVFRRLLMALTIATLRPVPVRFPSIFGSISPVSGALSSPSVTEFFDQIIVFIQDFLLKLILCVRQ